MAKRKSTYSLLPSQLDITSQILISVGKLIAVWANCETCFYAVYFCLAGRPNGNADIAWASALSTRRRMELVHNLLRYEPDIQENTREELIACIGEFEGATRIRNYFCHARYRTEDDDETIASIDQWGLAPIRKVTDRIFTEKSKPANKDTVNQICCAADRCVELNERVTKCVYDLREQLKLVHVKLPPLRKPST